MKPGQTRGRLAVLAQARWPVPGDAEPAPIPGFVASSFSPLVAAVAERCLRSHYGAPPADPARGARTAIVMASAHGDIATAATITADVDAGRRVAPLLFYQSVPNAAAGHIAARWGLCGPVICVSPATQAAADAGALAELLIGDGDADEVLIILAEQAAHPGHRDQAAALLLGPPPGGHPPGGGLPGGGLPGGGLPGGRPSARQDAGRQNANETGERRDRSEHPSSPGW